MARVELDALLNAGAHFGHLTRRWNPKMKPFIFMERNGIHIIDLNKTQRLLNEACEGAQKLAAEGKKIMFVGTKKQAQDAIAESARTCGMPFIADRWLGGMLTNFQTIRKSIKRLQNIEKMEADGTFQSLTKKERLMRTREKEKLNRVLEGIVDMNRLPGALFVVDTKKEHIAVDEARRLNIPIFAIVDTNSDPDLVDYPIPANDDAMGAVDLITKAFAAAVQEGRESSRAEREARREETGDRDEQPARGERGDRNDRGGRGDRNDRGDRGGRGRGDRN